MRDKIKLESTAGTGHFYTTTKNKKTTPEKMEIKKYDPKARKHVDVQGNETQVILRSRWLREGLAPIFWARFFFAIFWPNSKKKRRNVLRSYP